MAASTGAPGIVTDSLVWDLLNFGTTAYATTVDTTSSGIFKTTNGGASWIRLPFAGGDYMRLAADATGIYQCHDGVTTRSNDEGSTWTEIAGSPQGSCEDLKLDASTRGRVLRATWLGGVQTYTIASDLAATAAGQPTVPPAAGARAPFQFTVTNRGPHAVTGVTLNVRVSGRALFKNQRCSGSVCNPRIGCPPPCER
jgi:hypothetical protein